MISKIELKSISKLLQKKYRISEGKFIVEGKRLVSEGLNSDFTCDHVLLTEKFREYHLDFFAQLENHSSKISILPDKDFAKISSTKNPQGIAAIFEIPINQTLTKNDKKIICMENISDPGNIGTILRSCDWFGIKSVILSCDCADIYNPKVLRASMGAVFNLRILENIDIIAKLIDLKEENYKIYYADMKGLDYSEVQFGKKYVITFCNEAFGPSNELKDISDNAITIPKKGSVDSLNVAAAAAVILSKLN